MSKCAFTNGAAVSQNGAKPSSENPSVGPVKTLHVRALLENARPHYLYIMFNERRKELAST